MKNTKGIVIVVDGNVTIADFTFKSDGSEGCGSIRWIAGEVGKHVENLIMDQVKDGDRVLNESELINSTHNSNLTKEQEEKIEKMLSIARII